MNHDAVISIFLSVTRNNVTEDFHVGESISMHPPLQRSSQQNFQMLGPNPPTNLFHTVFALAIQNYERRNPSQYIFGPIDLNHDCRQAGQVRSGRSGR